MTYANQQGHRILPLLICILATAPAMGQKAASPNSSGPTHAAEGRTSAPDFSLDSVTGETITLSGFRGRVVVLNFWATWCGPCKIVMPWLADLQNEFGPRGLQVVGIALDDDATKVEIGESADQSHANYPILVGNENIANLYGGIPAMPETFLIDRNGKVVERIIGLKSEAELRTSVRKALEMQTEAPNETGQKNARRQSSQ